MAVRLSTTLRNRILDCIFNSGTAAAILDSGVAEFYTGAQPASANDAASGTLVASITLPAAAMQAASNGSVAKEAAAWEDLSANNAGTIGYVRFRNSGDTDRIDASVTNTGGGGDVTVDNSTLTAGQSFSVTAMSFTMPAST